MIRATSSEKIMASEAPTGMGRMYGPIRPRTKAMGSMEAMTVKVARMVGLPTSWIARRAESKLARRAILKCRWMFSTTMMVASMTIPVTRMRANSVTRFRVYPNM
jgi:hypothetical protein